METRQRRESETGDERRRDRPVDDRRRCSSSRSPCWMSVVLPWVDSETEYSDAVEQGVVVQLADGITLVPARLELASGALAGETRSAVRSTGSTELVRGKVAGWFDVHTAPFDGTASALLARINEINADVRRAQGRTAQTTGRYAVTTRQGVAGVAEDFVSVARRGSVVAFVFGRARNPTGSRRTRASRSSSPAQAARCRAGAMPSSR